MGFVETSKTIENVHKSEKYETLVFRSDFYGLCPAWLAKIKKSRKHSSRLASFAKVGGNSVFSLSIRPLRPAFSRMMINGKKQSSKQYCFNNNLGILHVCVVSWIFYMFCHNLLIPKALGEYSNSCKTILPTKHT